jgi:ribosomal-protein-alanine N-acetyltransferase
MNEGVEFRSYQEHDLQAMVDLDEACFAPPFRFSLPAMRRFVEAGNAWVTIAEMDGVLAGFCIVHREREEEKEVGYVVTIDVTASMRGRGLGEKMLGQGEAWVQSWHGAGMLLHVFMKNPGAIRFYERLGYERVGVERGFYGVGLDGGLYWKAMSC